MMPTNIVIKAPNQRIEDQSLECSLDWTVKRLKDVIEDTYPGNPKAESQKLIYSGHLLTDNCVLKDVLYNNEDNNHILHLVCMPSKKSVDEPLQETQQTPSENTSTSQTPPAVSTSSLSNNSTTSVSSVSSTSRVFSPSYPYPVQMPMPYGALSPEQMAQQVAMMQQLYAQYISQYIQNVQTGTPLLGQPHTADGIANEFIQNDNQQPRPNNEVPGAAVAANDDEDEIANRDWLDWFYVFIRAIMLFSIVYFYSSFGRFLIVTGVGTLLYLFQGGWLGVRQPNVNPNGNNGIVEGIARPDNVEQDVNDNQDLAANENADDAQVNQVPEVGLNEARPEENVTEENNNVEREARDTDQPAVIATVWTLLSSFFASLIPEQPEPVNIN